MKANGQTTNEVRLLPNAHHLLRAEVFSLDLHALSPYLNALRKNYGVFIFVPTSLRLTATGKG